MDSVTVVIAAPGSRAIPRALERLAPSQWLAEGEALELQGRVDVSALITGLPVDANVLPAANRRKALLLADMDSTMIGQECIDELGVAAGAGDKIKAITVRAMRGELNFEAALRERASLLKDLPFAAIDDIIANRLTFTPGGATLLATMKKHGAYTALVSGGFTQFTAHVAATLGFDENAANTLLVEDGRLTGHVTTPILGQAAKVEALDRITAQRGLRRDDAIAVGDGANDIPMLQAAGLGVALHAKPHVQDAARVRINHGDLTALLYLQGYRRDEFVER